MRGAGYVLSVVAPRGPVQHSVLEAGPSIHDDRTVSHAGGLDENARRQHAPLTSRPIADRGALRHPLGDLARARLGPGARSSLHRIPTASILVCALLGPQWDPGTQNAKKPPCSGFELFSNFSVLVWLRGHAACDAAGVFRSRSARRQLVDRIRQMHVVAHVEVHNRSAIGRNSSTVLASFWRSRPANRSSTL